MENKKKKRKVVRMGLGIYSREVIIGQGKSYFETSTGAIKILSYGKRPGKGKKPAENCMRFAQNRPKKR